MSQLLDFALQANIYLQPVQFTLITITNIINICILRSRILRSPPCTYYFLGYAISSIAYTLLVCPTQFLRGYHIDWANTRIGCKLHYYIVFLPPFIARMMLVLAALDRYYSSSYTRQFYAANTKRMTRSIILVCVIASTIYMSPMSVIYYFNESNGICLQYTNTLITIYIFSQMTIFYMAAPVLMFACGLLTIINIRQHVARTNLRSILSQRRRTEGQLARMLVLQVTVHLIITLPFGIVYLINAFDPSTRTPNVLGIRYILVIWQQCDYFMSFFLYVFSGSVYRREFFRLIRCYSRSNRLEQQQFALRLIRKNING
ncbi:unnamed protein product [Adineta ricciae]|uniref:G-protein coupled receptors family 1 profile domain-containing protein n=1 Tax=Adineta ricciae TaxID=249248 RepID=A0A815A590_ADIRI|nr:unnamed protein product [Adineta ricciae]